MTFLDRTTATVQYTTNVSKQALKDLWVTCFPEDGDGFAAAFLRDYFRPEQGVCIQQDGEVQSALYMLPCTYRVGDKTGELLYIYAMCTHPHHRRKGNLRAMLEFVWKHCIERGIHGMVLHALDTSKGVVEAFGMKPLLTREAGDCALPEETGWVKCSGDFETFYRLRTQHLDAKPAAILWPRRELAFIYEDLRRNGKMTFFQNAAGELSYCAEDETDRPKGSALSQNQRYCAHIKMVDGTLTEEEQAALYFNLLLK